jgi:hypothetical protein
MEKLEVNNVKKPSSTKPHPSGRLYSHHDVGEPKTRGHKYSRHAKKSYIDGRHVPQDESLRAEFDKHRLENRGKKS